MEKCVENFQSRRFLEQHIAKTLQFYEPRAVDPAGGFFHYFLDDGTVYNATHRHLVSATRFVFNGAMARRHSGRAAVADWARHGLAHLEAFRLPSGLYAWTVNHGQIEDATVMAYGQAFVLLAKAHAFSVGCATREDVADAFDRMNDAFFRSADRAYADEITPEGTLLDYRGQNANMHMCEACLAAHEFTGDVRYLDRAEMLIERFAFDLAAQSGDLVWEHYHADWSVDWDYNKDNPGNIFKPWGFQSTLGRPRGALAASRLPPWLGHPAWGADLWFCTRPFALRHRQIFLGASRVICQCVALVAAHGRGRIFAAIPSHLAVELGTHGRPRIWCMVSHLGCRWPKTRKHQITRRQGGLPHHGRLLGCAGGGWPRGLSAQRLSSGGSLLGDAGFLNHFAPALDIAVQQLRQLRGAAGLGFHIEAGQPLHHLGVGQHFGHLGAQAVHHFFGCFAGGRQGIP
jgi:N-acylglucosamine 2-epimerase (GlcNAc 2-epimerase)